VYVITDRFRFTLYNYVARTAVDFNIGLTLKRVFFFLKYLPVVYADS